MIFVDFTCLYCNNRWKDWVSEVSSDPKCAVCKETKMIKAQKVSDEKRDVYGYRFDQNSNPQPPAEQPKTEPAKPSENKSDDTATVLWDDDGGSYVDW